MEPKSVIGIYIYICIIFLPGVRRENVSSLSLKIKKKKKEGEYTSKVYTVGLDSLSSFLSRSSIERS